MAHLSPLKDQHALAEATLLPYGPVDLAIELVETFGELDFEYAALRKACGLLDQPHRGTIEIVGDDRHEFLNNMVTQELKGRIDAQSPYKSARAFWLNRKGRVVADLRLTELPDRTLVDLDAHAVDSTIESLNAYIITEDVELRDASERLHRLALHGPTGMELLRALATQPEDAPPLGDLAPNTATVCTIADHDVIVERQDTAGEIGLELTIATDGVKDVYTALVDAGSPTQGEGEGEGPDSIASRVKLRQVGWLAYNTARIEAGTPLFNVDFSTESLPAETGVLDDRVSFTKGCYLGQEVVARMHALGKPKQVLVALKPEGPDMRTEEGFCRQPMGGTHVLLAEDRAGDPVGAVTSSTISPMLGGEPVCFAIVKTKHADTGTRLGVMAEGVVLEANVRESLTFHTSV